MTHWDDDWEERRDREEATAAVDDWVSREGTRVHASAGLSGPWGPVHPVAWADCSGRITASDVEPWRQRFDVDPSGVAALLAQCVPGLGPQGPAHVRAAAGITAAAGVVPAMAETIASPPRPRGARNAVDELRDTHPGLVDAASKVNPPPTLFAEGDMPRTTASGLEVAALKGLPWRAVLAATWEPNRLDAFRITQDYAGPEGDNASRIELAGHPAVTRHIAEVNSWATSMPEPEELTPEQVASLYPKGAQE